MTRAIHDKLETAEYGEGSAEGPNEYAISLVPENAAAARDAVMKLLTSQFCGLDGMEMAADVVVADALLVTSELVTNGMLHGGGVTGFAAELTDEGLRITVTDTNPELPVVSDAGDAAVGRVGGYGWTLIRRLAERVTVSAQPGGKSIEVLVTMT